MISWDDKEGYPGKLMGWGDIVGIIEAMIHKGFLMTLPLSEAVLTWWLATG